MKSPTRLRAAVLLTALMLGEARQLPAGGVDLTAWADLDAGPIAVRADVRYAGIATAEGATAPTPVRGEFRVGYTQEALPLAGRGGARRFARRIDEAPDALRSARRLLLAESDPTGAKVVAADGGLTRAELDSIQLAADPLDVDALLPVGEVPDSGTWKIDPRAIDRLLRVSSGEVCEVVGVVGDVSPTHARLRFAGPVHGLADGARVEIDLRGVALFDRQHGRLTRVHLAWRERRAVGPATPAVELNAKLNLEITPLTEGGRFSEEELKRLGSSPTDDRLEVAAAGWTLLADRAWFVVADDRLATTLRRVSGDKVSAVLTLVAAGERTLEPETFEAEVRAALGASIGGVDSTGVSPTGPGGLRRLTVTSHGMRDGQPVRWRHYHLASKREALAATATLLAEAGPADDADIGRLVESVRPPEEPTETAATRGAAVRR